MSKKVKIKPEEGLLVAVKLSNNKFGIAQIVKTKEDTGGNVMHTIWAFFDCEVDSVPELLTIANNSAYLETPLFVCGMDFEELEKGKWLVVGRRPVNFTNVKINEDLIKNLQKEEIAGAYLLQMYLGIVPWNMYKDPEYLDKRLLPGFKRPKNAIFK